MPIRGRLVHWVFAIIALAASVLWWPASSPAANTLQYTPEDWQRHVVRDIMPDFITAQALGDPVGNFQSRRCDAQTDVPSGTTPAPRARCISSGRYQRNQPLVGQSRMIFTYAAAFHMTGDVRYLDIAKRGTQYLFAHYINDNGLFHQNVDRYTRTPSPQKSTSSQMQAYGLIGPALLYTVTHDAELLDRLVTIIRAMQQLHSGSDPGCYTNTQNASGFSPRLPDHLDHLNAYRTLLARQQGPALAAAYGITNLQTLACIDTHFYDPAQTLYRVKVLNAPEPAIDFGHTIKTLWFAEMVAQKAAAFELFKAYRARADAVLRQAFLPKTGSWATGYDTGKQLDPSSTWWVSAELSQYAAFRALTDDAFVPMLNAANQFWLTTMVDKNAGGIWARYRPEIGPDLARPKYREWKAGFHVLEHALINYIVASYLLRGEAVLFYAAGQNDAARYHSAYLFPATLKKTAPVEGSEAHIVKVSYTNVGHLP